MKNNNTFPTNNHKDHFIYDNKPFINPEHGKLQPIEWATVIDTSLITWSNKSDFIDSPEYYLQVTVSGEIRGVTHEHDEHEDYLSVTASDSDVRFLKAFSTHYPNDAPTLLALQDYRKYQIAKLREQYPLKESTSHEI
ncbi:MAG: hypothetical protein ACWA7D_14640 [Pseudomonas asiatica]|uniref:hypothetical protein n=1 Tax=Pseudomonas asiatica TaxID=2219225 RepID=UPI000C127679|nr:hypothetical protein [Pseudomonas asiatica]ATP46053.1 hypothetical protein CR511_19175 [Pseudomonas putida]MDM9552439.1 hypothetical protein [Pseudomonas asiatica]WJD68698.1 hypothetical protein QQ994_18995 [Pseudomonas asiatica]